MRSLMKMKDVGKLLFLVMIICMIGVIDPMTASAISWGEMGDAGSLPGTAQIISGNGTLDSITGEIWFDNDVDMYQIYITGGGTFSATTVDLNDPVNLDTRLFLFDLNGYGIYMNDNVSSSVYTSTLPSGHSLTPTTPGLYYLAIATNYNNAEANYLSIFPDSPETDVVGPTGDGGGSPITGWSDDGYENGGYTISLTGAEFVPVAIPEPGTLVLLVTGLIGLIGFKKI